jgi:hypothetical protein
MGIPVPTSTCWRCSNSISQVIPIMILICWRILERTFDFTNWKSSPLESIYLYIYIEYRKSLLLFWGVIDVLSRKDTSLLQSLQQ